MGVLYERNPIVNFFIESYGLNRGMFIVKTAAFVFTVVIFQFHVPGSNLVRNVYIVLIAFSPSVLSYVAVTIYYLAAANM